MEFKCKLRSIMNKVINLNGIKKRLIKLPEKLLNVLEDSKHSFSTLGRFLRKTTYGNYTLFFKFNYFRFVFHPYFLDQ